ncbi:peptidoglycan DD-metalloendopeptidase family protein [Candidatus Berkiella aquae]|uniref:Murein hydrolase activator NlpD n=1 Tax=Candidatus Berkiella aquae TaxID=295108 RepID=A0A0Q9YWW4_9GAMM|nr:peptidoglycan DD-metalloendopeptidase family protein [Candidatus Berkiella aquae]MCS5711195.1 peptidoglycan DD-metalloendopeptidase family protein [Candidatus Berkiella aquae]
MKLRLLTMALLPCFTGCSTLFESQEAAPVVSLEARQPITKGHHTVLPGETLYAIAWEYGHDYRDLAVVNHIAPPYRIYPGQKIALNGQIKVQKRAPQQSARQTVVAIPSATVAPVLKQPAKTVATMTPSLSGWQWPAKGKVVKTFSTKENAFNKGIDIAGNLGAPVLAAQSGKVVYSGGGLRGYGQLIIIKHNEAFLSAYAHNHRLFVKEGDTIKQGQAIAEMGQTDTDQVKLHFEIRQNGQPVNPILFLPKVT